MILSFKELWFRSDEDLSSPLNPYRTAKSRHENKIKFLLNLARNEVIANVSSSGYAFTKLIPIDPLVNLVTVVRDMKW